MIQEEEDIKSGTLWQKDVTTVFKGNSWHEKWFVLSGSNLYWFKNQREATSTPLAKKKKSRAFINLSKASRIRLDPDLDPPCLDAPAKDSAFQIISNGQVVTLCAQSKEQTGDWVHVLESAIAGRKDLNRETVIIQEELRKADFDIPPEDLEFTENEADLVGAGASGIVRKGLWLRTTEVAVKALKNVPEFTDSKEMTQFYKEIEVLSKLRHINIVQMYGFCRKEHYICLITEFVKGGNLSDCLRDPSKYPLDMQRIIELSMSIVRGMVYLHNQGVIHRDLKPANILIENWMDAKVKVCDFGISRVVKAKQGDASRDEDAGVGSPQYAAPELKADHDSKVDVFSYAIILWELAMGEMPWPEIKYGWEFAERYDRGDRPPIPNDTIFGFLIKKCWQQEPLDRPTFQQVYKDLELIQVRQLPHRPKANTQSSHAAPSTINHFASRTMLNRPSPPNGPNGVKSTVTQLHSPTVTQLHPLPNRMASPIPTPVARNNMTPLQRTLVLPRSSTPLGTNGHSSSFSRPPVPIRQPQTSPNTSPVSNHFNGHGDSSANIPIQQNMIEAAITRVFDARPVEAWTIFANALVTTLHTTAAQVDKLRYVFDTRQGGVEKATWLTFLQWFTPLSLPDAYHNGSSQYESNGGYDMDTIVDICSPSYFHGFLDSKDAQNLLKGKSDGTFLLRFSTQQPGFYTLSVAYAGTVGHWRISCEKRIHYSPMFKVETRVYRSLEEVVSTHRAGREPLKIKPKPGQPEECFLTSPYNRPEASDSYYQVV